MLSLLGIGYCNLERFVVGFNLLFTGYSASPVGFRRAGWLPRFTRWVSQGRLVTPLHPVGFAGQAGCWFLVSGIRYAASGFRHPAPGTRYPSSGTRYPVSVIRHLVTGHPVLLGRLLFSLKGVIQD